MNIHNVQNLDLAKLQIYFHFCKAAATGNRILLHLSGNLCCENRRITQTVIALHSQILQGNRRLAIFTLTTAHTTYQMQADAKGYLLHLYYGARTAGEMDYLLNYADRGFSGNPDSAGSDRTYSLDALPQEYPSLGTGDFRNYAVNIQNGDGSQCCNLVYISHKITSGKYALNGLPVPSDRLTRSRRVSCT